MCIHQAVQDLQTFIDNYAFSERIRILEAGSRSLTHVTFHGDSCIVFNIKDDIQYYNFAGEGCDRLRCRRSVTHRVIFHDEVRVKAGSIGCDAVAPP